MRPREKKQKTELTDRADYDCQTRGWEVGEMCEEVQKVQLSIYKISKS